MCTCTLYPWLGLFFPCSDIKPWTRLSDLKWWRKHNKICSYKQIFNSRLRTESTELLISVIRLLLGVQQRIFKGSWMTQDLNISFGSSDVTKTTNTPVTSTILTSITKLEYQVETVIVKKGRDYQIRNMWHGNCYILLCQQSPYIICDICKPTDKNRILGWRLWR